MSSSLVLHKGSFQECKASPEDPVQQLQSSKSTIYVAVNCPYGKQACYSLIVVWFVTNALCFEITHHLIKLAFPEPLEPMRIAKELDQ